MSAEVILQRPPHGGPGHALVWTIDVAGQVPGEGQRGTRGSLPPSSRGAAGRALLNLGPQPAEIP
jgi:hypothetical protein